jgi:DNA-binding Lrp family transcriptional regulator
MGQVVSVKEIALRLVAELLKDSHRSDRELAKVLGISQPTVSKLTERLRKMGVIREYTIIPDFNKLGFTYVP